MRMRSITLWAAAILMAAFLWGCDDGGGGSGPEPTEGPLTAGPGVVVADYVGAGLFKFSFAGAPMGYKEYAEWCNPEDISIYQKDGSIWVTDISNSAVYKVSETGVVLKTVNNMGPAAVSVNQNDGSCWVCDQVNDRILRLDSAGAIKATATGFNFPADVACYSADGSCWVADVTNCRLVKLSPGGGQLKVVHLLGDAGLVAVDPNSGNCWASDGGDLIKVSSNGTILKRVSEPCGNHGIGTITVSPADGSVYIFGGSDKLIRFDSNANKSWEKANLNTVRYIAVNKNDNTVWVAGNEPAKVYKMSAAGGILKEITASFEGPFGVDIVY